MILKPLLMHLWDQDREKPLDYMYNLGKRDGFSTHDVDHIAGRIEAGKGEDVLGIYVMSM